MTDKLQVRDFKTCTMISVVIPLYNKETSVAQSLQSVLSQSYDDFEVVIVDDGSTDGSVAIVEAINDPRIRLIRQENGGPSKARNTGVKNARGEWIVFLDADDELLPGAIEYFADLLKAHQDCKFLAAPFYNGLQDKAILHCQYKDGFVENPYKGHFFGRFLPRTGAFVCARNLCQQELFNECIRRFEDLEWLYRIYKHTVVYTGSQPVLKTNMEYSSASRARKDIKEDFLGYLDFKGKSFWEKMALYSFYLGERDYYPEQCCKLYPWLYWRYDWLLIYKMIGWLRI